MTFKEDDPTPKGLNSASIHLGLISIMPEMTQALEHGVTGRALALRQVKVDCWNPRDWAPLPYRQVDDTPYGGGPGMVLQYEPLATAIRHAKSCMPANTRVVYLSPQGKMIKQRDLNHLVLHRQSILFVAGRFEGIDERVLMTQIDEEWSIGDFVLTGGELAALVFMDAMIRLVPGVVGDPGSVFADSFMQNCLDYPHYTKPASIDGYDVPPVLLSGDHAAINTFRRQQALGKTWLKRPDLLEGQTLTPFDEQLLEAFKREHGEE